jgi:DNA-binding transcriptional regulator YdaS (Cro superfamily)
VKKSISYRQYATQCRAIAAAMEGGELRSRLLNIAADWESLADSAAKGTNQYMSSSTQSPTAANQP